MKETKRKDNGKGEQKGKERREVEAERQSLGFQLGIQAKK